MSETFLSQFLFIISFSSSVLLSSGSSSFVDMSRTKSEVEKYNGIPNDKTTDYKKCALSDFIESAIKLKEHYSTSTE